MPIVAWNCPACKQSDVPLDHFEKYEACGDMVSPDFAAAILKSEREHYRFGERAVGSTDVIGCPRKGAITADEDYSVDPLTLNAIEGGTAWHRHMEGAHEGTLCEVRVSGRLGGVDGVTTAVDRIRGSCIEDWKTANDFDKKRRATEGAKADHVAQVSLGAILARQNNFIIDRGLIRYRYQTGQVTLPVELWDEARLLAYKPVSGAATVADNLGWADRWRRREVKWQDMPLTGEAQSYGDKSACDYCSVRSICWTQSRGAAF